MKINLYPHQTQALDKLKTGSILMGGVGSGKSRTSLAYFFLKECGGTLDLDSRKFDKLLEHPKDLYIITTARKRDTLEWLQQCSTFMLSQDEKISVGHVKVTIDSWNNVGKYIQVQNAFFIFDEQRVVGYGAWAKSFIKIAKSNNWILLSATPGDTWIDYIPVFIANGFYRNKTDFIQQHVMYARFSKYQKVDHYVGIRKLQRLRAQITVDMPFQRATVPHHQDIIVPYDTQMYTSLMKYRWDPWNNQPVQDIAQLCYLLRKVVNSSPQRFDRVRDLCQIHKKTIIFYNYNYELDILRQLASQFTVAEWNGQKHEPIPSTQAWVYLVQYTAGAQGWNCITSDTVIFYSQSYSYKAMVQAAGRIDRMNTPFTDLYYYHVKSKAAIDSAISRALRYKKNFNQHGFLKG